MYGRTQVRAGRDQGRVGERRAAEGRRHLGWRDAVLAGVRSPPLRGEAERGGGGLTGKCRGRRVRRFSRRGALCAPALRGRAHAHTSHYPRGLGEWPVVLWGHASVKPLPSSRACGARPSEARPSQGEAALGGRAGNDAKGGFLGGTHSVRPRGKAGPKPREIMIRDELARGRWPKGGAIWVGVMPSSRACGARPSEARPSEGGRPYGERPETTREAVSSEGRGLRVREYGPDASPGRS